MIELRKLIKSYWLSVRKDAARLRLENSEVVHGDPVHSGNCLPLIHELNLAEKLKIEEGPGDGIANYPGSVL